MLHHQAAIVALDLSARYVELVVLVLGPVARASGRRVVDVGPASRRAVRQAT